MADALFITEQYLKDNSVINDNTDMKILVPIIILAQDKYIKPILGSRLFNEITDQINNGTVSANNKTLLDNWISKALLWWIMAEGPVFFLYRFTNKGILKKNSENSNPAELSEIRDIMQRASNNAEFFTQQIVKFLIEKVNDYPLYLANTDLSDLRPKKVAYDTGLWLGGTIKKRGSFKDRFQGNIDSECI